MLNKNILYDGIQADPPASVRLRAGPLQMDFIDGSLRYIRYNEHEVLRRVYVAVRDKNWGTVPAEINLISMDISEKEFNLSFHVEHRQQEIDFVWDGTITGNAQGTLEFHMDGIARSDFLRNRIGFCVLHPADLAGSPCTVRHVDGSEEHTRFPGWICPYQPVQPFCRMSSLAHQVAPGVWADVHFTGEVFEMEDQRNWTDASFKTFGTPLHLPFPVLVQAGTRIQQCVRLELQVEKSVTQVSPSTEPAAVLYSIDPAAAGMPIPEIGLCMAEQETDLNDQELERLRCLRLDHLRVDLPLADPGYPRHLIQAARLAEKLGVSLDIALLFPVEQADSLLPGFRKLLEIIQPAVKTFLVYPQPENLQGSTPVGLALDLVHRYLDNWSSGAQFAPGINYAPGVQFALGIKYAAGTNTDFIFLQRSFPPQEGLDLVTLALHPQAHAFDNASLVETLRTQQNVVASARHLAGDLPVMVSPVTLKPRFNPYATGGTNPQPGALPPRVDVRQVSLFGAGWTAISLKYLSLGGASRLTYYETSGLCGVMQTQSGSPMPEAIPSVPGCVYPLYHVLAALGEFKGGQVLPVDAPQPLVSDAILLRIAHRQRLVIVNFTASEQPVTLAGITSPVQFSTLDETSVLDAMRSPEAFRNRKHLTLEPMGDLIQLRLLPYGIGFVDFDLTD
jgi:hypothetical protein